MELVILIGLPASGKSTFYRARLAATHRHVSKDLMPNVRDRDACQARLISQALQAGESVAVDNTNVSPAGRAPLIALARTHGARVVGYFFETTTREAVGRNRGRSDKRVPNVAIFAAAKRLVVPTRAEGFDALWRVQVTRDGGFDVNLL
jgi:predicted kinase